MAKPESSKYLPLTEEDLKNTTKRSCQPKLFIVISALAEVSFICTSFIVQHAYTQSTATLEFGPVSSGYKWGIWITYYSMVLVNSYRIWCYYNVTWKLHNNPDSNTNTHDMVSCCGITFAVLSFALETTFMLLALLSTPHLPGAPRLMLMTASHLLGVVCCRVAIEITRTNRSKCALSGSLVCVYVLQVLFLASFLTGYGPIKGACYKGLDYKRHVIVAQCNPGQDAINAPCWLHEKPHQLSIDAILNQNANTVAKTNPFEVSFNREKKKMALVVSYVEKSWIPTIYSAKALQFSCSLFEHGYCRSCSVEEVSRLQVQVQSRNKENADVSDNTCVLRRSFELKHNPILSFNYCLSVGL